MNENNDDELIDTDNDNDNDYNDVLIVEYDPEILVIKDHIDDTWVFNVNLYQDLDSSVYRIKSQNKHTSRDDAIMDANGVIELLGFSAAEPMKISCLTIDEDSGELHDEPVWFDGLDIYPCNDNDDETDDEEHV